MNVWGQTKPGEWAKKGGANAHPPRDCGQRFWSRVATDAGDTWSTNDDQPVEGLARQLDHLHARDAA